MFRIVCLVGVGLLSNSSVWLGWIVMMVVLKCCDGLLFVFINILFGSWCSECIGVWVDILFS